MKIGRKYNAIIGIGASLKDRRKEEMRVRTIKTTATVTTEGTLVVPVPPDIQAGSHEVVVMIEESMADEPAVGQKNGDKSLPVHDLGVWPDGLSLRREDLYDEWGR
jgi:hypothetical protein